MATKTKPADNQIPVIIRRQETRVGSPMLRFAIDGGMAKSERYLSAAIYKVAAALEMELAERKSGAPVSVYAWERRIVVEHSADYELPLIEQAITAALEVVGPLFVDMRR